MLRDSKNKQTGNISTHCNNRNNPIATTTSNSFTIVIEIFYYIPVIEQTSPAKCTDAN